jgi:hypothetical protein
MATRGYIASEQAWKRIERTVRYVERMYRSVPPQRARYPVGGGSGQPNGFITFTTSAALLASDASQDDCPVELVWEGADPGDTVTIYNELGFESDASISGYAKKCAADGKWKIIIIPCPAGSS